MALKLSSKALKNVIDKAADGIGYEDLVNALTEAKIVYNEHMLKGFLEDGLGKGHFVYDKKAKTYGPKPKISTGGTPTVMYRMTDIMNPPKSKFEEKPYDKAVVEADPLWRSTKLGAVKAGKAKYYLDVYWPKLMEFVALENANGAKPKAKDEEKEESEAA